MFELYAIQALWYQYRNYAQKTFEAVQLVCVLALLSGSILFSTPPYYAPNTVNTTSNMKAHYYQIFLGWALLPMVSLAYIYNHKKGKVKEAQMLIKGDSDKYQEWWGLKLEDQRMRQRDDDDDDVDYDDFLVQQKLLQWKPEERE